MSAKAATTLTMRGLCLLMVLAHHSTAAAQARFELTASHQDVVRLAPDSPTASSVVLVSDAQDVVFDAVTTVTGVGIAVVTPGGFRADESTIGSWAGPSLGSRSSQARRTSSSALSPLRAST